MPRISEPVPYEEAARIVAEKQIMSKEAFDALCDELKARAFVVTGLEDLRAVQEIRDAIAELPRGAAWKRSDERRVTSDERRGGPGAFRQEGRTATPRPDVDAAGEGEPLDVHVGMREAAREVWKGTQGPDGAEHLVAVDYRTGKKFGKPVKGTSDGVSARKLLEEARAKGTPIAMVHSHPSDGGVPSPSNVEMTLRNADILKATGVVEWDRSFHVIRVGAEWWKRDEEWRNHWLEWLPRGQETMPYPNWVEALEVLREKGVIEYEKNAPIGI